MISEDRFNKNLSVKLNALINKIGKSEIEKTELRKVVTLEISNLISTNHFIGK